MYARMTTKHATALDHNKLIPLRVILVCKTHPLHMMHSSRFSMLPAMPLARFIANH